MLRLAKDRIQRQPENIGVFESSFRAELFSNSPPWWMLKSWNPSGLNVPRKNADADDSDNLKRRHEKDFAYYLVVVAKKFREDGIEFTTVEPFNEPRGDRNGPFWFPSAQSQEGCVVSVEQQQRVLKELRGQLDVAIEEKTLPPTLQISASDENAMWTARDTWEKLDGKHDCTGKD